MKHLAPVAITLGLAILAGSPASALILWQQTYDPAAGGLTSVSESIYLGDPGRDLYVSVAGGLFSSVGFEYFEVFEVYWWDEIIVDGEYNWIVDGENYFTYSSSKLASGGKIAILDASYPPDYFTCYSRPAVQLVDCGRSHTGGLAQFYAAEILTDQRFTITVSDVRPAVVPEPQAWVLAIAGFGLAGAMLRRRRGVGGRLAAE